MEVGVDHRDGERLWNVEPRALTPGPEWPDIKIARSLFLPLMIA
jgi:hypothetical protein